jgi:hypothetical protein
MAMYFKFRLALQPDAIGVRASEEFVGDQSIVDTEPVRKLTFGAPDG